MRPSLARKARKAAQKRQKMSGSAYNQANYDGSASQDTEVPIRQGGSKR
jgi:hypothetical protein